MTAMTMTMITAAVGQSMTSSSSGTGGTYCLTNLRLYGVSVSVCVVGGTLVGTCSVSVSLGSVFDRPRAR